MFDNFFKGKKVFLTGHTGFKGSWLCLWLNSLGAKVHGYSDTIPTKPSLFEQAGIGSLVESTFADIRDLKKLKEAVEKYKPDLIFHFAAQALVRASYDHPVDTFSTNAMGTVHMMEAARTCKSALAVVIATSDKCYQNRETGKPFVEDDPMGGDDPYSASKGAAELVFHSFAKSYFSKDNKTSVVSVRAGNVIGGGDWAVDRIVPDAIRAWGKGQPLTIRSPQAVRPWQHVLEPLYGYMLAAKYAAAAPSHSGSAFNFGPGAESERPVLDLIQILAKSCEFSQKWQIDGDAATGKKEALLLKLNAERAKTTLKWRNILNFEESVEWTGRWYNAVHQSAKKASEVTLHQIQEFQAKI